MLSEERSRLSRRDFVKKNLVITAGASAGLMASGNFAYAGGSDALRLGLVGCGGRGTGAAVQALQADPGVELVAMGDAFRERLEESFEQINSREPDRVKVPKERRFVGLDAYQHVIDSDIDVVILATPPAFRPEHMAAAVEAGAHMFIEKPVAVDAPGVRSVMESVERAKEKGLAIGSGFVLRYDESLRETAKRVHEGAIGEIQTINNTRFGGRLQAKFPGEREPGWSDLEFQLRNWYNFCWLSGDFLVEMTVHNIDRMAWMLQDRRPVKAVGSGGQQVRRYGDIFDHFFVQYEFENGLRTYMTARQQDNSYNEQQDVIIGTEGICEIGRHSEPRITGKIEWQYEGESENMYQVQHDELFASIRAGEPINDGTHMAGSTLMAIMGRMAAYTGQEITWEEALNSEERLVPEEFDWAMRLEERSAPVPGETQFV